jgi:hypothetical protein
VVLARSISGNKHFCEIVALFRPPPNQDWRRAKAAGYHFSRDDKEPGPTMGKRLPGERLRETAKTCYTSPQPSRYMFGGKAPLRFAAQKNGLHAPSAPVRSALAYFLCKWEYKLGYTRLD